MPSFIDPKQCHTVRSTVSLMNVTWPSPNRTLTPPGWLLRARLGRHPRRRPHRRCRKAPRTVDAEDSPHPLEQQIADRRIRCVQVGIGGRTHHLHHPQPAHVVSHVSCRHVNAVILPGEDLAGQRGAGSAVGQLGQRPGRVQAKGAVGVGVDAGGPGTVPMFVPIALNIIVLEPKQTATFERASSVAVGNTNFALRPAESSLGQT